MEVASSDYVGNVSVSGGLAEALKRRFLFYVARTCRNQTSLAFRKERTYYRVARVRVFLVEDSLLPGIVRGLFPERQPL